MNTSNKTTRRNTARLQRAFIKAMLELEPVGKASLYASIMSLSAAGRGEPAEAREWWQVVSILTPDVAQKLGQYLRP